MHRYRRINIEISNICNLQCSFCPEVHREKQIMNAALFRKIMAQAAPLTEEVCLHLMGEPLGHPDLPELIAICREFDVPINLSTNGLLLTSGRIDQVLNPIVRQINFSVHSFTANFPGRDVSGYVEKILRFTRLAMTQRPDLYINFRLWDLDADGVAISENAKIRELILREFDCDLDITTVDVRRKKGYRLAGRVYLNFDSRFDWPSLSAPLRGARGTCHGLKTHFGILADGSVVPCCLDKEGAITLGNVNDSALDDILSCPRSRAIRSGFDLHQLTEDLCQRCTFIQRFDRKPLPLQATL